MTDRARVYVDQSPDALGLVVAGGRLDPSQFHVLATTGLTRGNLEVELGIIGASHYLLFEHEGQAISEVLACVKVESPLSLTRVEDFLDGQIVEGGSTNLDYRFQAHRIGWEEGQDERFRIRKLATEYAQQQGGLGLQETFPAAEGAPAGETIVAGRLEDGQHLQVETLHSYPNEESIVVTRTEITIKE